MTRVRIVGLAVVFVASFWLPGRAFAAGLNTDVALTPPEGGTIVRVQWRHTELSDDPTPLDRETSLDISPVTVVHGLTENFTILGTVPIIHADVDFDAGPDMSETGVGDIPLLAKYRFYQRDEPGRTTRWAAIVGVEVPTYDEPFSSESVDPIIGTVWTHQELDWWVDSDLVYKLNTAGGLAGDDELRADAALSYRLFGGESERLGPWGMYLIGEVNTLYITDGSTRVFLSPGVQFITPRWIIEAGVQLPVHQDLASPRLETDFTTVLSVRVQF